MSRHPVRMVAAVYGIAACIIVLLHLANLLGWNDAFWQALRHFVGVR